MTRLISYVLPRDFAGFNIPMAVQAAYIRDYARRKNFQFSLPITELCTSGQFFMLHRLIEAETEDMDIAAVSAFCFPLDRLDLLTEFIELAVRRSKAIRFHCILEQRIFTALELKDWAEETIFIRRKITVY